MWFVAFCLHLLSKALHVPSILVDLILHICRGICSYSVSIYRRFQWTFQCRPVDIITIGHNIMTKICNFLFFTLYILYGFYHNIILVYRPPLLSRSHSIPTLLHDLYVYCRQQKCCNLQYILSLKKIQAKNFSKGLLSRDH